MAAEWMGACGRPAAETAECAQTKCHDFPPATLMAAVLPRVLPRVLLAGAVSAKRRSRASGVERKLSERRRAAN